MKEYMGMPHFPERRELLKKGAFGDLWEHLNKEEDAWTYSTTFGDLYQVITRPDGTLTVKKKDAI
jgi:hypothetical protein